MPRISLPLVVVVALFPIAQPIALGQAPTPVGSELFLNEYVGHNQRDARVGGHAGGFVVVFRDTRFNSDCEAGGYASFGRGLDSCIQGRRFSSTGTPLGGDFRVNTTTGRNQEDGAVAVGSDGRYVVVWQSDQDSGFGIKARRYDSAGTAQGGEISVGAGSAVNRASQPRVGMASNGDFVVVYQDFDYAYPAYPFDVRARRYSSSGTALGASFLVASDTEDDRNPEIAVFGDGDFVVVWDDNGADGSSAAVQARLFTSTGTPMGTEFVVNTYVTGQQQQAHVGAASDGSFAVVWQSSNQDGQSTGIFGQLFGSDGAAVGGEFQVNTYTTDAQDLPAVSMADDGKFVVAWQSLGGTGTDQGTYQGSYGMYPEPSIQARAFAASGSAMGDQFQVNTYTTESQKRPTVSHIGNSRFIVAWQTRDGRPGAPAQGVSAENISGQLYDLPLAQEADLAVSKAGSVGTILVGGPLDLTYTLTVTNNGPSLATNVILSDPLPAGVTFVSSVPGGPTCTELAGTVTCTLGSLAASAMSVVTINVTVNGGFQGVLSNTASVASDVTDSTAGNDSATETTLVTQGIFSDGFESGDVNAWSTAVP